MKLARSQSVPSVGVALIATYEPAGPASFESAYGSKFAVLRNDLEIEDWSVLTCATDVPARVEQEWNNPARFPALKRHLLERREVHQAP